MTGSCLGRRAPLRNGTPVAAREPHSGTRFQLRVLSRMFSVARSRTFGMTNTAYANTSTKKRRPNCNP